MTLPAAAFPLTVSGARILDAAGQAASLGLGVNWGGGQQDECVPYGLDKLPRGDIITRIADGWRMTHVRVPFALGGIVTNSGTLKTAAAPAARLTANTDLDGATPWEILQELVDDLTVNRVAQGKDPVITILNQHMLYPGWCCTTADDNGLWYNGNWPSSTFTNCWLLVADRFKDNPYVHYDLHNEPRPATIGGTTLTPTWGDQSGTPTTDMRLLYTNTAARIRTADPDCLIICEGLSYAADLSRAGALPVGGPNIIYSVHDYSWFHENPDGSQQSLTAYFNANDTKWGYLAAQGHAPVWVGEFGSDTDVSTAEFNAGWFAHFMSYYQARPLAGACWWELSGTDVLGTEPVTNIVRRPPGRRESFGLIAGQDAKGSQTETLRSLAPIIAG